MDRCLKNIRSLYNSIDDSNFLLEYYKDILEYEVLVKEYKKDFISYQDYLKAPVKKQGVLGRVKEYGMATMKRLLVMLYTIKNNKDVAE